MKKHFSHFLCLCMVFLMIFGMVACANNSDTPAETTTGDQTPETTTASNGETTGDSKYNGMHKVPKMNLNRTVRMLYWADVEHEEFVSETETADAVLDGLYKRNNEVKETLGITFTYDSTNGNAKNIDNWVNYVRNNVSGETDAFDILAGYSIAMGATATAGFALDLLDDEISTYLTVGTGENEWWPTSLIDQATINDKLFFCSGDISANSLYMMYTCFVNTDLQEEYRLENPQDLVVPGKWTYDKFIEMCRGVYEDLDGSQTKTLGDRFGYMTSGIHVDPWLYGAGVTTLTSVDGELVVSEDFLNGSKLFNGIEKLNNLLWATSFGLYTKDVEHQKAFNNGQLLFAMDRCRITITRFDSEDLNFVVVPCPKATEEQENYYSAIGNPFTLYSISKNAKDPEEIGAVLEVMANTSFRKVTPPLFEITLKYKKINDETSRKMYDIVHNSLIFDMGRIFNDELDVQKLFRSEIQGNKLSWASDVSSQGFSISKKLEKILDAFE